MNAIELLKQHHLNTKDGLERMSAGEIDPDELRLLADELVAHMMIEEHVFYPRIRELDEELARESFEEHAVARFELARAMTATGEDQKIRLTVLKELVEHHIEEEETELFPKVMRGIPMQELEALGAKMELMFEKGVEAGLEKLVVSGVELRTQNGGRNGNGARANGGVSVRARAAKGGRSKAANAAKAGGRASRAQAR